MYRESGDKAILILTSALDLVSGQPQAPAALFILLFSYLLQLGCYLVAVVIFTCKQNMKLVTTRFKSGGICHSTHCTEGWVGPRAGRDF